MLALIVVIVQNLLKLGMISIVLAKVYLHGFDLQSNLRNALTLLLRVVSRLDQLVTELLGLLIQILHQLGDVRQILALIGQLLLNLEGHLDCLVASR